MQTVEKSAAFFSSFSSSFAAKSLNVSEPFLNQILPLGLKWLSKRMMNTNQHDSHFFPSRAVSVYWLYHECRSSLRFCSSHRVDNFKLKYQTRWSVIGEMKTAEAKKLKAFRKQGNSNILILAISICCHIPPAYTRHHISRTNTIAQRQRNKITISFTQKFGFATSVNVNIELTTLAENRCHKDKPIYNFDWHLFSFSFSSLPLKR